MLTPVYPPKKAFTQKVCSKAHGGCGENRQMPKDDHICGTCTHAWSRASNRSVAPLQHLRRIRRAKDITQAQLARKARVAESTIRQHEKGLRKRTYKDVADSLARALGVEIEELIEERGTRRSLKTERRSTV